ncbi:MAG: Wzz/FepE/Etk N-terminal domain-containing protein [Nitratireductor sp.]|jgi:uncharacterized protein involved in exopolysaccharide biosynthesis|nr:Wzz/FepE/Etk N-terminal domain-containing protein [Nitratireductor sp.]
MNKQRISADALMGLERLGRREHFAFGDITGVITRNYLVIAACMAIALALASAYLAVTPATYRAQAQLLLDPKLPQIFRELPDYSQNADTTQIETHMVALKSRAIASDVVNRLQLWKDPAFQAPSPATPWLAFWRTPPKPADPVRVAVDQFQDRMAVEREGISQVINVSFFMYDPEKATRIVNEITRAYIRSLIEVRADAARAASEWLEQRLADLRLQMNAAAQRAQNFRANEESATLEELQLSAETYRKAYQNFFSAFTEAVQRESYPVSTVRIISDAAVPRQRHSPRAVYVFGLALAIGAALGLFLAILRENRTGPME